MTFYFVEVEILGMKISDIVPAIRKAAKEMDRDISTYTDEEIYDNTDIETDTRGGSWSEFDVPIASFYPPTNI
jgi:hypothetical protein